MQFLAADLIFFGAVYRFFLNPSYLVSIAAEHYKAIQIVARAAGSTGSSLCGTVLSSTGKTGEAISRLTAQDCFTGFFLG